jgi:hypothetical protein
MTLADEPRCEFTTPSIPNWYCGGKAANMIHHGPFGVGKPPRHPFQSTRQWKGTYDELVAKYEALRAAVSKLAEEYEATKEMRLNPADAALFQGFARHLREMLVLPKAVRP